MRNGYGMVGRINGLGVHNLIPRSDAWAWKTKRILEGPNSDTNSTVGIPEANVRRDSYTTTIQGNPDPNTHGRMVTARVFAVRAPWWKAQDTDNTHMWAEEAALHTSDISVECSPRGR